VPVQRWQRGATPLPEHCWHAMLALPSHDPQTISANPAQRGHFVVVSSPIRMVGMTSRCCGMSICPLRQPVFVHLTHRVPRHVLQA
jgi:hypothetical protein